MPRRDRCSRGERSQERHKRKKQRFAAWKDSNHWIDLRDSWFEPAGRAGFETCTGLAQYFDHRAFGVTDPASQTAFMRFRSGEDSAFDSVVSEYTGPAYATAVQVLGDPARAEEAVQDGFVRVWRRAAQFDPQRGSERTWILAVVRNSAIDMLRKRSRTQERSIEESPNVYALRDPSDTWQTVLEGLTAARVRQALEILPPDQQEVVVKTYYEGVRPVEIARQLNIPEGTVRSRLRLGLARLRESLAPVREELSS